MRVVALISGALAAMVIAGVALAGSSGSQDLGRRLTGPFCINKKTGLILSVAAKQECKPGYVRKYGAKVTGPVGPKGDTGPQGLAGAKGDTGSKGDKGDTGATGPAGQTLAAAGEPGAPGKDGKDAVGMITGVSPAFFEEGPCLFGGYFITFDIFNPITVCNGMPGPPGMPGMPGMPGLPGTPGAPGDNGSQGDAGPQGPQGDAGPQGPQGEAGPQGPQGDTGPQGPQGETGPQGDTGPQGPQGDTGPQGPAGVVDASAIVEVSASSEEGENTVTALCPLTADPEDDPAARLFAISGGFSAHGSVTESYRSNDGHGWTATQSASDQSLTVYAYCVG